MSSSYVFTAVNSSVSAANGTRESLNAGAENDDAEGIFRKHFNPGIQMFEPGWNALIGAISAGDQINFDNGKAAINQLWIHSASGIYLDRRAADQGVVKPDSIGISDEVFRRLTIKTTTKKVVTQSLLEAMEVFYGTDSTRASLTSVDGPYALEEGWTLLLSLDGESTITVPFVAEDFTDIGEATAQEVAAVITRWLNLNSNQAYALAVTNALTGGTGVRVYSGALGLRSSVQCLGGQAQNELQFPTLLTQVQMGQSWSIQNSVLTAGIEPGTVRFTVSGASTTDLTEVVVGDYVNIYGVPFNDANKGTFAITKVDVRYAGGVTLTQYFEVSFDGSVPQSAVQIAISDMMFYRPTKTTINDNGARAVVVSQNSPDEVNAQLPATTIAVSRTVNTGAYLKVNDSVLIFNAFRNPDGTTLIDTCDANGDPLAHGLVAGGQIFLDGLEADDVTPDIIPGNGTTTTDATRYTYDSSNVAAPAGDAAMSIKSLLLDTGAVFMSGGWDGSAPVITCHRLLISNPVVQVDESIQYTYAWQTTADLPAVRANHAIVLLNDTSQSGNVLLSGGIDAAAVNGTSYIYDVTTNAWWDDMPLAGGATRQQHSMVTLNDGRVLLMGGYTDFAGTTPSATAQLFTPVTTAPGGSWATNGSMLLARAEFPVIKLEDGTILIMGGSTGADVTEKCEIYNPDTGQFTITSPMGYARCRHQAVALPNNKVFVWGGTGRLPSGTNEVPLTTAEIYDGNTGRWYPVAGNPYRSEVIGEDSIAYLSGRNQVVAIGRGQDRIDMYDVSTGQWLPSPAGQDGTTNPTVNTSLVALTDYPIVVQAGGSDIDGDPILGAQLFISSSDKIGGGGLNGVVLQIATVPSATSFTVETPDYAMYLANATIDATVTGFAQVADNEVPGPYIYSPDEGFSITDIATLTTTNIFAGTKYKHIVVTTGEAADFPDEEGWIVFGFGTAQQLGPVKYVGREDSNTLILDYGIVFPQNLGIGTSITLLDSKSPFVPVDPVEVGSLYITDSSSGRVAAIQTLDSLMAAGLTIRKTVVYPGDIGLGASGFPVTGSKISDIVEVFAGNEIDAETKAAREEIT